MHTHLYIWSWRGDLEDLPQRLGIEVSPLGSARMLHDVEGASVYRHCYDLSPRSSSAIKLLRSALPLQHQYRFALALCPPLVSTQGRVKIRRIVSDLDGTLTAKEGLVHLAECLLPSGSIELQRQTESAMLGREDFTTSFRRRSQLFSGLAVRSLCHCLDSLPLSPSASRLSQLCQEEQIRFELATSAYDFLAQHLQRYLSYESFLASETRQDKTGHFLGLRAEAVVDAQSKANYLLHSPLWEQTLAIGDGANDLEMLALAPYALLYNGLMMEGLPPALPLAPLVADLLRLA